MDGIRRELIGLEFGIGFVVDFVVGFVISFGVDFGACLWSGFEDENDNEKKEKSNVKFGTWMLFDNTHNLESDDNSYRWLMPSAEPRTSSWTAQGHICRSGKGRVHWPATLRSLALLKKKICSSFDHSTESCSRKEIRKDRCSFESIARRSNRQE